MNTKPPFDSSAAWSSSLVSSKVGGLPRPAAPNVGGVPMSFPDEKDDVAGDVVVVRIKGGGAGLGDLTVTVVAAAAAAGAAGIEIGNAPGPGVLRTLLPELKPEANELVASTLARSDNDDSSKLNKKDNGEIYSGKWQRCEVNYLRKLNERRVLTKITTLGSMKDACESR